MASKLLKTLGQKSSTCRAQWDMCSVYEEGKGPKAEAKMRLSNMEHNSNNGSLSLINPIFGSLR